MGSHMRVSRMQSWSSEGHCKLPVVAFREGTGLWLGAKWFECALAFLFSMQPELLHTYVSAAGMTPFENTIPGLRAGQSSSPRSAQAPPHPPPLQT